MKYIFLIGLCLLSAIGFAQTPPDSTRPLTSVADSMAQVRRDSLALRAQHSADSVRQRADSLQALQWQWFQQQLDSSRYSHHPYFSFRNPERRLSAIRNWTGKEGIFYGVLALLLFFGLIRAAFSRYLTDLFRLYFRTSIKQRLIKEQLAHAPLPSLLFNLLFLFSGSLLVSLLLLKYPPAARYPLWQLYWFAALALAAIYLIKFLVLKMMGWLLGLSEATNTYIFVVFTTNKVLGILLLPLLIGLAFTSGAVYEIFFTLCLFLVGAIFVYRFYFSYLSVHKLIRINFFHFLLYLCAFEIAPLLLINKLLVGFFTQTH